MEFSIASNAPLDFHALVDEDEQAEVALLLVVRAKWFGRSPILGLAQCRRTYCHHLVLEFLSVHPAIVGRLNRMCRALAKDFSTV